MKSHRLPRFRLRVRTVLSAVAAVALLLGAWDTGWRWIHYRHLAEYHTAYERDCLNTGQDCQVSYAGLLERSRHAADVGDIAGARAYVVNAADMGQMVELQHRYSVYHAGLKSKYHRAASWPWLRVEPDPPQPN